MNMIKALALYAALIAVAVGIQHALVKMSRDADAPILAIAQAQQNATFGAQISASQLAAITTQNANTIAADKSALARAERVSP